MQDFHRFFPYKPLKPFSVLDILGVLPVSTKSLIRELVGDSLGKWHMEREHREHKQLESPAGRATRKGKKCKNCMSVTECNTWSAGRARASDFGRRPAGQMKQSAPRRGRIMRTVKEGDSVQVIPRSDGGSAPGILPGFRRGLLHSSSSCGLVRRREPGWSRDL